MSLTDSLSNNPLWGNLLFVTMILAALTPVIMAILAFRFSRMMKGMNQKQWSNQKIVDKRLEVYDRMAPKLNDLCCFYCYVGNWKEITPMEVLDIKKDLDKDMQVYATLFSDDLSQKFKSFMLMCFVSISGWEHDEKIKSFYELRQENCKRWENSWIPYFDTKNVAEGTVLKERYDQLNESFKADLIVVQHDNHPGGNEVPA